MRGVVLSILFGVGVSLALVELVVRLFLFRAPTGAEWNDRPQFYYSHEAAEFLRDTAYQPQKPPGTYRIAVVGDSFSFAPYMQFDDTFPKRLERILNLRSNQPRVEVLNYGVPRYSTNHEVALVERAVRENADLILLQVTLNDPEIKPYRPTGLVADQVNRFGQLELQGRLYTYWRTAAFVRTRLFNLESKNKYEEYFKELFRNPETVANFTTSLDRMVELSKKANTPLVAVVFPLFGVPLDGQYPFDEVHAAVARILGERGIQNVDISSAYRGIPLERLQVMPGRDFHPNEIGHRIAAEQILTFLVRSRLLPAEILPTALYTERIDIRRPSEPTYRIE